MTTTIEFITALFCQVDDQLAGLPKHPKAHLWPSEVVTFGAVACESREMPGVMPLPRSPRPQGPCPDTSA